MTAIMSGGPRGRDCMANCWRERVARLAAVLIVGVAPIATAPGDARASEPDPPALLGQPAVGGAAVRFAFKGAEFCVRCHRSEQSEWCDTATTAAWRHDAHALSHLALRSSNPRTMAIENALGITAVRTAGCVACHTHPADEPAPEEEIPEEENRFFHAGISCETCHGAGAGYVEPHLHPAWRFLPPEEKARHGMIDLRHPALKAENCLACHMGDPASGRVVPHAAYAAGHPPLGAFDIEAASRALGPHWKRVWEKSERIRDRAAAADYRVEAASTPHRSLVGALVALRESALLVQDAAAAAATAPSADLSTAWPELSLYDCQACHHDLAVPSRRQQAGYGGLVPGRPGLVGWPRRAAEVALATAEMPIAADALLAPWTAALAARPFGRPDEVRAPPGSAATLARIDAAIAALVAVPRDGSLPGRQRVLAAALAAAGPRCSDLDGARAVGWILADAVDSAAGWSDAERLAVRTRLEAALGLRIPGPGGIAAGATPFWRTSLDAARAYDPAVAAEAFRLPTAPAPERLPPR